MAAGDDKLIAKKLMDKLTELPKELPAPVDDGACQHLLGRSLPSVALTSTQERPIDLAMIPGRLVIYCYPMTGQPGVPLPDGWNGIPGARGCTPQSCAFRDHYQEFRELGAVLFGLSTQNTVDQQEAKARLHLPFELLSDHDLAFTQHLQLPTFEIDKLHLIKRLTIIAQAGKIVNVFYPVFPPDKHPDHVIDWLKNNRDTTDQDYLRTLPIG